MRDTGQWLVGAAGLFLIFSVLLDAFETIVLPRRVTRQFRLTRLVYRLTWIPWSSVARHMSRHSPRRESFLSFYGPLSLIILLLVWVVTLVVGFGLLFWGLGSPLVLARGREHLSTDIYLSGTNFITLGIGDVDPNTTLTRAITVIEAATGFGFFALVISYLPTLYQAFSRREARIALLDARAGSPPTAVELLRRAGRSHGVAKLDQFLYSWEEWSAELLESHLSYPTLAYFRSQHENQSWLGALTMILDACSLVLVGVDGVPAGQAQLTFAMARHAAVDLSQVFGTRPEPPSPPRLTVDEFTAIQAELADSGLPMPKGAEAWHELGQLRELYEPYVNALARRLLFALPSWLPPAVVHDDWAASAWESVWAIPPLPDFENEAGWLISEETRPGPAADG